jgi:hypothetical protein
MIDGRSYTTALVQSRDFTPSAERSFYLLALFIFALASAKMNNAKK